MGERVGTPSHWLISENGSVALVPDVFQNLPNPFHNTYSRIGIEAVSTAELIAAFDQVLAGLQLVSPIDSCNPLVDLFFRRDLGSRLLSWAMPTLSSITLDGVENRLRDLGYQFSAQDVAAVGRHWVRLVLETLRATILWIISERAAKGGLARHAPDYLAVVERHIGAQGPLWGPALIDSVAWDVEEPAIPLLERIAATESLDPIVRQRAAIRLEEIVRRREVLARTYGSGWDW